MSRAMSETIKDLMPETPDLNAERLGKLKELFPDLFSDEGALSETELRKLVDPDGASEAERYEFRWFGKSDARRRAFTPTRATLNYDAARSLNPEACENLIVEGENLEVLKLLLCSYREQIKCIYIDPPYNTGKDFVYSDRYAEGRLPYWRRTGVVDERGVKVDTNAESDGRFHSNWLSMMFSRLLVARQLLRPDGVMFISIDDNEVHNLRRLCNEVFGEDNFVGVLKRRASRKSTFLRKAMSDVCDYVVIYSKNEITSPLSYENVSDATRPVFNQGNAVTERTIPAGTEARCRSGTYAKGVHVVKSLEFELLGDLTVEGGKTRNDVLVRAPWRVRQELLNRTVYVTANFGFRRHLLPEEFEKEKAINDLVDDPKFYNEAGTEDLAAILGHANVFESPKPSALVEYVIRVTEENSEEEMIVLDFFAGSGVTGQAVLQLNARDGGRRKFILVQLPELTAADSEAYKAGYRRISDITIERNRRVAERLAEERRAARPAASADENNGETFKGLGFKVFRLEDSYFPRTEWSPDASLSEAENVAALKRYIAEKESQLHIDFDRDKLLFEILLKEGFKLNFAAAPYAPVTSNRVLHVSDADREALVCLDPTLADATVEHFKTHHALKFICLERSLDTSQKWNLHNYLGEKFKAF